MKIIIVGCGRVGSTLAELLASAKHNVTIIDQNSESFYRLKSDFSGETVIGDGTDEDILKRAGIEAADAFAAVTNGDNRNIMAAQIAKHIFNVPSVVCRIYDPIRQETYNELGLTSISPTTVGAKLMLKELLDPQTRDRSAMRALATGASVPVPPVRQDAPTPSSAQR